ncbi:MAG: transposase [Candidatus Omnitrophica bacterium]|nr:transposase [Candidatus Omnitrophota bacterium]
MPTLARYHQLKDEIMYHIYNRGNRKLKIFHDEEDHYKYKELMMRDVKNGNLLIFHYSTMGNHYHIEAEFPEPEKMSSIIGGVNRGYTNYYHRKYKTSGYLWQGRFASKPIESNEYSIICGGYIEMNPVRAGNVESPEDYKHSSAGYYILGKPDELITEDRNYHEFGKTVEERREKYLNFLMENFQTRQEGLFREIIGSDEFKRKLCKKAGRWVPRRKGVPGFVS